MPRSASPFSTSTGFWVPPPGTTLILRPAFSRSSSAMPPEMLYQPPPTAPAVQVSDGCAAAPPASTTTRARAITASLKRFRIGPASCLSTQNMLASARTVPAAKRSRDEA